LKTFVLYCFYASTLPPVEEVLEPLSCFYVVHPSTYDVVSAVFQVCICRFLPHLTKVNCG